MPVAQPIVAVIDDEPEMRKAFRRLLSTRGYTVEEYASGEDLLAALGTVPMDFLLLDLHMPGVSGLDVLKAVRTRHLTVPIIVITAHDEPGSAEEVRALGAAAYLKKPVDRADLLSAIVAAGASSLRS